MPGILRLNSFLRLLAAVALAGCAQQGPVHPVSATDAARVVRTVPPGEFGNCQVKVLQGDQEVVPRVQDGRPVYKLQAAPFRVEVPSTTCRPAIALVLPTELEYITRTPLIFGVAGYRMAGTVQEGDILTVGGGNPRTTIDEEIGMATSEVAWAQQQYEGLCAALGYCPTPVKHYASSWPFTETTTGQPRTFADFHRFDQHSPMSRASGRVVYAVVYTDWRHLRNPQQAWASPLYVLRPQAMVFDFR